MGCIGAVLVRIVLWVHFLEKPRRPEFAKQVFRLPIGGRTAFGPEPDSFQQQNADDHGQYGCHQQHSKNRGIQGHGIFTPMEKNSGFFQPGSASHRGAVPPSTGTILAEQRLCRRRLFQKLSVLTNRYHADGLPLADDPRDIMGKWFPDVGQCFSHPTRVHFQSQQIVTPSG
jgi:hypothetical protein